MTEAEIVKQDDDDSSGRFIGEPDEVLEERIKGFLEKSAMDTTGVNRERAYLAAGFMLGVANRFQDQFEKELLEGGALVFKYLLDEHYGKIDQDLKNKEEDKLHDRRIEDYTGR